MTAPSATDIKTLDELLTSLPDPKAPRKPPESFVDVPPVDYAYQVGQAVEIWERGAVYEGVVERVITTRDQAPSLLDCVVLPFVTVRFSNGAVRHQPQWMRPKAMTATAAVAVPSSQNTA